MAENSTSADQQEPQKPKKAQRLPRIVIKRTADRQFMVLYKAANGEILAITESLKTMTSCRKNINSMRKILQMWGTGEIITQYQTNE